MKNQVRSPEVFPKYYVRASLKKKIMTIKECVVTCVVTTIPSNQGSTPSNIQQITDLLVITYKIDFLKDAY